MTSFFLDPFEVYSLHMCLTLIIYIYACVCNYADTGIELWPPLRHQAASLENTVWLQWYNDTTMMLFLYSFVLQLVLVLIWMQKAIRLCNADASSAKKRTRIQGCLLSKLTTCFKTSSSFIFLAFRWAHVSKLTSSGLGHRFRSTSNNFV